MTLVQLASVCALSSCFCLPQVPPSIYIPCFHLAMPCSKAELPASQSQCLSRMRFGMHLCYARFFPLTRCNFGFGATFCPTVRTGQDHISRAFMCANTRLFYLSPNMRAARSSRAHQAHSCPDSHQNIDPCHRGPCASNPSKMPLCCVPFLLPFWDYPSMPAATFQSD